MIDKITGKTITNIEKKKQTQKTAKVGSSAFDALVDAASGSSEVTETQPIASINPIIGGLYQNNGKDVPQEPKERGAYILQQMEQVQQDILSGDVSEAAATLKKIVEDHQVDISDLPDDLQKLLQEIDLRASVEIAKIEEAEEK